MLLLAAALFAMFYFFTVFVQSILHYSPLKTGFIYLPLSVAIVISAQICAKQLVKVGPKPFMVSGAVMTAGALYWLSLVNLHSTYVANLLGPLIIFGLGMGFLFVPLTMVAVSGVEPAESGFGVRSAERHAAGGRDVGLGDSHHGVCYRAAARRCAWCDRRREARARHLGRAAGVRGLRRRSNAREHLLD